MAKQTKSPKSVYNVEFLLSFTGEERLSLAPYHGRKEVVLEGNEAQTEQLKNDLEAVVRKYIAGLNEYPEEIVLVELVKFDRKDV